MSTVQTAPSVLVVDLDGTLLRSDMLYETFWSAVARDWRTLFTALAVLPRGRLALKTVLAGLAPVDETTLPYDRAVIDLVRSHREAGGRTALVSASEQGLVRRIADHLGLFDEAHGSQGGINLKGAEKRAFLAERYGDGGFVYAGDSRADLEVWKSAETIITVNAGAAVRAQAEQIGPPVTHMSGPSPVVGAHVRTLRPHQWLKNGLIFVPLLASHSLDLALITDALLAFVGFCLIASGVYVLNDLLDLTADRAHPRKRHRAFASGTVPPAHGLVLLPALLAAGGAVSLLAGWAFALVMAVYFVLTTAYSLRLKRQVGIDICALAILYSLRIVAGGVATGIAISSWLLAFSLFFFFALAALKRQGELVDLSRRDRLRASGRGWTVEDLSVLNAAVLASGYLSVLVMALYVNSDEVRLLYGQPAALWGVCVILFYWITRAELLTNRGQMHDDPIIFAIRDRVSHYCLGGIMALGIAGAML
ncbi:MAG: UbiA family prenyltransferase [Candidatus Puniceispirillaceae bacterium]